MTNKLSLQLFSPDQNRAPVQCDSIRLPIVEDEKGRFSGSYGIRPGHARAVLALGAGTVRAYAAEKEILSLQITGGFATVEQDTVQITVDGIQ